MKNSSLVAVPIFFALFACKLGGKPAAHCDASQVPENEFCFEYTQRDFTDAKAVCKNFKGVWAETGACSRQNALGVCKLSDGINKIFYSGTRLQSADNAKLECAGTWAGPNE